MDFFDISFWKDFSSNALSTFVGILIGIPVALWVSNYQNKVEEKERKKKILRLLKHELFMNLGKLSRWKKDENKIIIASELLIFLKTEYWNAFSDGGELQWIKDPVLLSEIAEAYNFIRMISNTANEYANFVQTQYVASTGDTSSHIKANYRNPSTEAISSLWSLLEEGVENTKFEISKALKSIEAAES
jgi:hypothetical protein